MNLDRRPRKRYMGCSSLDMGRNWGRLRSSYEYLVTSWTITGRITLKTDLYSCIREKRWISWVILENTNIHDIGYSGIFLECNWKSFRKISGDCGGITETSSVFIVTRQCRIYDGHKKNFSVFSRFLYHSFATNNRDDGDPQWVITNDVSGYISLLVRIAHIICNHTLLLRYNCNHKVYKTSFRSSYSNIKSLTRSLKSKKSQGACGRWGM